MRRWRLGDAATYAWKIALWEPTRILPGGGVARRFSLAKARGGAVLLTTRDVIDGDARDRRSIRAAIDKCVMSVCASQLPSVF